MTTAFGEGKKTIIFPCWRDKRAHLFDIKDFTGALAMWAVKQSPHDFPKDLTAGLAILKARLLQDFVWKIDDEFNFRRFSCEDIRVYLDKVFEEEEVFKGWNTPKIDNGASYAFVTRYSKPDPDRDFIDTGAMARNIAHIMFVDKLHWEDQDESVKK